MGEVGSEALRGTWSGTLFSASSRDYGILLLNLPRIWKRPRRSSHRKDFLNRARNARCIRSHSSGIKCRNLAHRARVKDPARAKKSVDDLRNQPLEAFETSSARSHRSMKYKTSPDSYPRPILTPRPMGEVGSESARNLEWDLIQRVLARLWNSASWSSSGFSRKPSSLGPDSLRTFQVR
jgi:hypothetical protein